MRLFRFREGLRISLMTLPNYSNVTYMPINNITSYGHKNNIEVEKALNIQIQIEQQAAQDYLNIAINFLHPEHGRPGSGSYFMSMYEEELAHMRKLIFYQLKRGGTPKINGLNAPASINCITMLDAFKEALNMEKRVTKCLENLVAIAETEKDYHCIEYITNNFLSEQMGSINELTQHVSNITRLCSDESGLYHYDLVLAEKYSSCLSKSN